MFQIFANALFEATRMPTPPNRTAMVKSTWKQRGTGEEVAGKTPLETSTTCASRHPEPDQGPDRAGTRAASGIR